MFIEESLFPIISITIICVYIILFIIGLKRGFLLQLVDLLSIFIALFIAWLISPVLSNWFMIIPSSIIDGSQYVKDIIIVLLNNSLWFVIVFVTCKILLLLIKPLLKGIGKLPIIKSINVFFGGIFSIIKSTIYVLLFMTILNLPFINNGQEVINNTILKYISGYANTAICYANEFINNNESIEKIIYKVSELSDNDRAELIKLLEKYNITKETLEIND